MKASESTLLTLLFKKGQTMSPSIIRLPKLIALLGISRSSIYNQITSGVLPKPINIGRRAVGWIEFEIQKILDARINGKSEIHIKEIVSSFHEDRPIRSLIRTPNLKSKAVQPCQ